VGLLQRGPQPLPVPLTGVEIEASVKDFASRVVVSQRYRNEEAQPIEAVYVFPLEDAAAVCGFEAVIDGVHVVGQVQEKEKAFETYDDALADGHGAYLLDQERPDVFTASIGNIPPGKEVLVRITYVAELELLGDALRFALPTTVSPRYAPTEDQQGVGRPPSEALNPPRAFEVPYGLSLSVDLDMHAPIRSVESPSHPISVETDGPRARVRLGGREAALDRDFVLNVRVAMEAGPWARLERDAEGRHVAMLSFRPQFDVDEAASEIVFLIDRSGSMQGTSIEEARNALQLCLRSLTTKACFNIVGFGSDFQMLFPESRRYDDASLAEASRHVAGLRADLGGTEILRPLTAILEKKPDPERPRQLFVLTDGQVTNTEAVIAQVRAHSDTTRVFTFGIGAGASQHLVRGMARAGGGSAEFIAPGERLEAKVLRQLQKALAPAVSDVKLDWEGLRVTQAPHHAPPCFAGGRLIAYGFVEGSLPADVTLRAHSPAGPVLHTLRLDPAKAESGRHLATLAARTLIRDLEEGASPLHDRRGSLQERRGPGEDRVKQEIVRLGVTYGLASKHTSFVAVERRETPTTGQAQLRRIPVALTAAWGALENTAITGAMAGMPTGSARPMLGAAAVLRSRPAPAAAAPGSAGGAGLLSRMKRALTSAARPAAIGAPVDAPAEATSSLRPLDRLVALQRADGSWDLTKELADVLGRPLEALEAELADAVGDAATARRALATALALRWLERHAAESRSEWALLEKKARRFLDQCPARAAGDRDWPQAAERAMPA
jgi:Ca-activated chloride channel family protein